MKKPDPTQELPDNYEEVYQLDLNDNRGLAMILNLIGIGLFFGVGWLLMQSLTFLRPEYLSTENILVITGMREFWRSVLLMAVSLGLMVVLNEGIRGIIFWVVTRQRPKLGFRGFYTYTSAPEWYIPRRSFLLIKLLPLVMITILGLIAIPIVSLNLVPGVMVLVSLNIAGGFGDIVTAYWILQKPEDVLVLDYGDGVHVYLPVEIV